MYFVIGVATEAPAAVRYAQRLFEQIDAGVVLVFNDCSDMKIDWLATAAVATEVEVSSGSTE